jgi:hypothetical protein
MLAQSMDALSSPQMTSKQRAQLECSKVPYLACNRLARTLESSAEATLPYRPPASPRPYKAKNGKTLSPLGINQ